MAPQLCYCGNVHAARDLAELLHSLRVGPALVRAALGVDRLSYGLWMSEQALAESAADGHHQLRAALDQHKLEVWTMNAFPVGNFHAPVVKYDVYRPHWADPTRLQYTLEAARLLALLAPDQAGTISTLPIGYAEDFEGEAARLAAYRQLRQAAAGLALLEDETGVHIRLCLEPEPGCVLESGRDVIAAFATLRQAEADLVDHYLGMCLDTCHHALAFEEPTDLLASLADAGVTIGKVQLSSAAELSPDDADAMAALRDLDEPRFLHQVRTDGPLGTGTGCDDLSDVHNLGPAARWRVHYHLPIYKERFGALHTTQAFLRSTVRALPSGQAMPHLEVETYTWGVLPLAERPHSDQDLASCIAKELEFARGELP